MAVYVPPAAAFLQKPYAEGLIACFVKVDGFAVLIHKLADCVAAVFIQIMESAVRVSKEGGEKQGAAAVGVNVIIQSVNGIAALAGNQFPFRIEIVFIAVFAGDKIRDDHDTAAVSINIVVIAVNFKVIFIGNRISVLVHIIQKTVICVNKIRDN